MIDQRDTVGRTGHWDGKYEYVLQMRREQDSWSGWDPPTASLVLWLNMPPCLNPRWSNFFPSFPSLCRNLAASDHHLGCTHMETIPGTQVFTYLECASSHGRNYCLCLLHLSSWDRAGIIPPHTYRILPYLGMWTSLSFSVFCDLFLSSCNPSLAMYV